jgi:hypothetical protein
VPHRIRPMGIDQQIGVDRNQSQPGYTKPRNASQSTDTGSALGSPKVTR